MAQPKPGKSTTHHKPSTKPTAKPTAKPHVRAAHPRRARAVAVDEDHAIDWASEFVEVGPETVMELDASDHADREPTIEERLITGAADHHAHRSAGDEANRREVLTGKA
jgi:hypothetical protein